MIFHIITFPAGNKRILVLLTKLIDQALNLVKAYDVIFFNTYYGDR